MLVLMVIIASLGGALADGDYSNLPFPVDCSPEAPCFRDLFPWCIKGRSQPVRGHCAVQEAICAGEELDTSNSCFLPYPINCQEPGLRACHLDLRPWCLEGWDKPVFGHCAVQDAICDKNAVFDFSNSCLQE